MNNCIECKIETKNPKFCSRSCSARFNNRGKNRHGTTLPNCKFCNALLKRSQNVFCNQTCQHDYDWHRRVELIENGNTSLYFKNYKKYLIWKYGPSCMKCGWSEINPSTGNVPIEINHIDGNSENNSLDNLELICPNCHSLTSTYKWKR